MLVLLWKQFGSCFKNWTNNYSMTLSKCTYKYIPERIKNKFLNNYIYKNVLSSTIYNNKTLAVTQLSTNGCMDKQITIHSYNGILSHCKK